MESKVTINEPTSTFAYDSLASIRKRLLDSSSRNALLNYKFPKGKSIEFVNITPNQLFEMMEYGKAIDLLAVPTPTNSQLKEYLKIHKNNELVTKENMPSATQWAKYLGINNQHEQRSQLNNIVVNQPLLGVDGQNKWFGSLEKANDFIAKRNISERYHVVQIDEKYFEIQLKDELISINPISHYDLQTLLYSKDLDARLKVIKQYAESSINETGSNILYLAIGFLEWKEREDSDKKHLAPLFTVPIKIERKKKNNSRYYEYQIEMSDEGFISNVTLKEKLKNDFGLILPVLDEQSNPEDYFRLVEENIIQNEKGWCINRQVCMAMLNFTKQAMYQDLDPAMWSNTQPIENHHIIKRIFSKEGIESEGHHFVSEYNLDQLEKIHQSFPIIYDADSSQHSALIDAVNGDNLVIEGPPGSGKSQTITNIIAAAINNGQKVLFVAEKMAALNVVKDRLDKAGLGGFCLELHSHKANKLNILKSLTQQYTNFSMYSKPKNIGTSIQQLESYKKQLNDYVVEINKKWKKTNLTVHEILAKATYYRNLLDVRPDEVEISNLDTSTITPELLAEYSDHAKLLEHSYLQIKSQCQEQRLESHFWYGVDKKNILDYEKSQIVDCLKEWTNELNVIKNKWNNFFEDQYKGLTLSVISDTVSQLKTLPPLNENIIYELIPYILNNKDVNEYLVTTELSIDIKKKLNSIKIDMEDMQQHLPSQLQQIFNCTEPNLKEIAIFINLMKGLPVKLWKDRHSLFDQIEVDSFLNEFEPVYHKLYASYEQSNAIFKLENLPSLEDLESNYKKLCIGGFFKYFTQRWWKSRRFILAFAKYEDVALSELQENFPTLIAYKRNQDIANKLYEKNKILAHHYRGEETALNDLRSLRQWYKNIRQEYGVGFGERVKLGSMLLEMDYHLSRAIIEESDRKFGNKIDELILIIQKQQEQVQITFKCAEVLAQIPKMLQEKMSSSLRKQKYQEILVFTMHLENHLKQASLLKSEFSTVAHLSHAWESSCADVIERIIDKNELAIKNENWLFTWSNYITIKKRILTLGLDHIINKLEYGEIPAEKILDSVNLAIFYAIARDIINSNILIQKFNGMELSSIVESFKKYDLDLLKLQREQISVNASRGSVEQGISSGKVGYLTEYSLISYEANKKIRHIPLRSLMERAPKSIQTLKPCFMMSPMSVAQYLKPGLFDFDLVIMDEASQILPEDAIGALARGKKAIIVGDPKQLPPTSFFSAAINLDDIDEDEIVTVEDSESILEAVTSIFKTRRLRWHYRSRHESLIAFSNKQFYQSDLVLFPSPIQKSTELGIRFKKVNGTFDAGRNHFEALAVVEEVCYLLRKNTDESIGVVAMNSQQRDEIECQLEHRLSQDSYLQTLYDQKNKNDEPVFIKNLENVQGDERDVIIISMTYGPTQIGGKVYQRFGPINQQSGWRRLNVLFTRSKKRMHIISSMNSTDILSTESSSKGVTALKDFLRYCETGFLHEERVTGKAPDSDFEIAVMNALAKFGYECEPQLGVAGFFLDLAVRNPNNSEQFLLGIECDGATYHSAKSSRDRDRLRQQILEGLGWQIHRIWSTDWFKNSEEQIKMIVAKLDKLKANFPSIEVDSTQFFAPTQPYAIELDQKEKIQIEYAQCVEVGDLIRYYDCREPNKLKNTTISANLNSFSDGITHKNSPLAQALLGLEQGDTAVYSLPSGDVEIEIYEIVKN